MRSKNAHSLPSLSRIGSGQRITIITVLEKKAHKRLLGMGLPPGTQVTVFRNHSGSVIVGQRGDRIAIGRTLAQQILVSEQNP